MNETNITRITEQLVSVEVHAYYYSLKFQLPIELELLRGSSSKENEDFARSSLSPAQLCMFPQKMKELQSIASKLRNYVRKYYIAEKLIHSNFVQQIIDESKAIIADFDQKIDEILAGWEAEEKGFRDALAKWLKEMNLPAEKTGYFLSAITSQIPEKDQFQQKARLLLDFNTVGFTPIANPEVEQIVNDSYKAQMMEIAEEVIHNQYQNIFDSVNGCLKTSLDGKTLSLKQRNKLLLMADSVSTNNIFNDKAFEEASDDLRRAASMDGESLEDVLTNLLVICWQYNRQATDPINMVDSVLDDKVLESVQKMKAMQMKIQGV